MSRVLQRQSNRTLLQKLQITNKMQKNDQFFQMLKFTGGISSFSKQKCKMVQKGRPFDYAIDSLQRSAI